MRTKCILLSLLAANGLVVAGFVTIAITERKSPQLDFWLNMIIAFVIIEIFLGVLLYSGRSLRRA